MTKQLYDNLARQTHGVLGSNPSMNKQASRPILVRGLRQDLTEYFFSFKCQSLSSSVGRAMDWRVRGQRIESSYSQNFFNLFK